MEMYLCLRPTWKTGCQIKSKYIVVNISSEPTVEINKLYGPWAVWSVRARLDYATTEWVIEQEIWRGEGCEIEWIERARFQTYPDECVQPIG